MIKIVTALLLLTATSVTAQFQTFLPKACQNSAQAAAQDEAPGSVLIAIVNGNFEIPGIGSTGMNLSDGKARAWIYAFHDSHIDSVFFKPFGNAFGTCFDASQFLPSAAVPTGDLGRTLVPNDYIEGPALIAALNTDGDYVSYHNANPDSLPAATVLTVSREAVLDFPAGTPFWFLTWSPTQSGPSLTCFVHAITAQTICVDNLTSVADDAAIAGLSLAPNPAFERTTLNLPMSWMGTTATIEIVDATGTVSSLLVDTPLLSPSIDLSLTNIPSGMYTLRIRNANRSSVIPMTILR